MCRKPGTDTKLPARFAGNWLSVPGFAPRDMLARSSCPQSGYAPFAARSVFATRATVYSRSEVLCMRTSLCLLLLAIGELPLAAQPDRRMFPARSFPPEIISQDELPRAIVRVASARPVGGGFGKDGRGV